MRRWIRGLAIGGWLAVAWTIGAPVAAHGEDIESLARRISGGAAVLADVTASDTARELQESARDFERAVDRGRGRRTGRAWRRLRSSYDDARRDVGGSSDGRIEFVIRHLDEDVAAADRLVDRSDDRDDHRGDDHRGDDWGHRGGSSGPGHASLVDSTICIGWNQVGPHPCPGPRRDATFRLPRDATHVRKISGEWRDYGRGARAVVLVNGAAVFEADVEKDWDSDGKDLDLRVPPGATVTLTSKNGDPMWVRKLDVEFDRN